MLFSPLVSFGQLFLPKSQGELIKHTFYSLSYAEDHEQAEWVHYRLDPIMLKGCEPRKDAFKSDSMVSTKSAAKSDYNFKVYGYHKGHLAPAADMRNNSTSMSESFYMSNISPQNPSFNMGRWKMLEKMVRAWANEGEVYITTGGVLKPKNLKKIGGGVSVPERFYKIIFSNSKSKMIGFLMPNKKINGSLKSYVVTVDEIESLTGIDFFHELEDVNEARLESSITLSDWDFDLKFLNPCLSKVNQTVH